MFRKLIFFISLAALTASAYTITYSGTTGRGYMLCNGSLTNNWVGRCRLTWQSTNDNYVVSGISVNGVYYNRAANWNLNITAPTAIEVYTKAAPASGYNIADGINSIEIICASGYWSKVVFAAPNAIKFENVEGSYLYPGTVDSVLVQAVDGDIECGTSTNGYAHVRTLGDNATVPNKPIYLTDGQALEINKSISRLFVRGAGKAIITGVTK